MAHERMQGDRIGTRRSGIVYAFEIGGNVEVIALHNASLS